jgi:uroporphyrinogen decarboxylase
MNSKDRMHGALQKKPIDRVPIFMWYHPKTVQILTKSLEIPSVCFDLVMCNDVKQAWVGNNFAMEGITHERDGDGHTDVWGIEWVKEGDFNQIRKSPLGNALEKEILDYNFPSAFIDQLLKSMDKIIPYSKEFFIGCDISPCILELLCRIRGMENIFLDLLSSPELSKVLLLKAADFAIEIGEKASNDFPLDWLWTGDDVGGQQSMMISPELWRQMIKPHLKNIFDVGKKRGIWVAYHSCGSIRPIIPDLIEIGLDVLNPIQCNCPGMNPLELKKEFGKELSFMGGVDTQYLLPNGTSDEVYKGTLKLIDGMTDEGGGYILAASHTIPPETPIENIFAMYLAAGVSREEIYDKASDCRKKQIDYNSSVAISNKY